MIVKGFEGQKVQDVKKPIQQKMIDAVSVWNLFFIHII